MNVQAKDRIKNILTDKKKNRKVISPLKKPLENANRTKLSTKGSNFKHFKGNNNNIVKCDFRIAFVIAHVIKYCNESHADHRSNRL